MLQKPPITDGVVNFPEQAAQGHRTQRVPAVFKR